MPHTHLAIFADTKLVVHPKLLVQQKPPIHAGATEPLMLSLLLLALLLLFAAIPAQAQPTPMRSSAPPRVTAAIDESHRVALISSVHPLLKRAVDEGEVDESEPADRLLLLLNRSPQQEQALRAFIRSSHTPGDPSFHRWLKPSEFGRLYGPADSDLAAIRGWLESHGLRVHTVHPGRVAIEFSGTARQLKETFHSPIHRYSVKGRSFLSNTITPAVPAVLAPVIKALVPVTNLHPVPYVKSLGKASLNPRTHQAQPNWTVPTGNSLPSLALAPLDFYKQYDLNTVYANNVNGTSQWIAIVSASNIDVTVVKNYQSIFSIPSFLPEVVIDGDDPGQNSAATEAYLDVELAISIAPRAKVLLYTSAGSAMADGLSLAAYRAVEDDVAGVISVSYGECEAQLGAAGNAFWSQLWQQAAAQGQTVFVAAGDGGAAGCDSFESQTSAYGGLAVNGLASTPYNVAVGGTDFYYSQSGGTSSALTAQLANYWSLGKTGFPSPSLQQVLPEQPWNSTLGYNINSDPYDPSTWNILAGGGGASSAALAAVGGTLVGYPKPAWQAGNGVPADGLRDLPDLSLFASNNANLSYYPICATQTDCTTMTAAGAVTVTAVGGTSASAPAMAAIQTLVNQAMGAWQGQANFIYYPLAAAHPNVFHDVTIGSNTVVCLQGTPNCVTSAQSQGLYTLSGFSATPGYDQASGLGSVDVANLIRYWKSVSFNSTYTTLSISPSTFVHGTTATITSSVVPKTSSGTPTGTIALSTIDGVSRAGAFGAFPLVNGTASANLDNLPGGTYYVASSYSGDVTYAPSSSPYLSITITPENNYLLTSGWAINPYDLANYPISSWMTLPYGAQVLLDAQPVGVNETLPGQTAAATGSVTFTDSSGPLSRHPLNVQGVAEWGSGVFAPGNHCVSATYKGDASFNPSSAANFLCFTILKGSTVLKVVPLVSKVAAAGATVTADVQLNTGYQPLYGSLPTGNVTVTLGSQSITVPWSAYGTQGNSYLEAVVSFSNVPTGILPLTAAYTGDANWMGATANGGTIVALSTLLTPTVQLSASTTTPAVGQSVTLTATVAGISGFAIPSGTITLQAQGQTYTARQSLHIANGNAVATFTMPATAIANGTNLINAVYSGNRLYTGAASPPLSVTSALGDFTMTLMDTALNIPAGGSAATTLVITPINGFSGPVSITASAGPGLDIEPAVITPNVSSTYSDLLTIYTTKTLNPWTYPVLISGTGGGHMHTVMIYVLAH